MCQITILNFSTLKEEVRDILEDGAKMKNFLRLSHLYLPMFSAWPPNVKHSVHSELLDTHDCHLIFIKMAIIFILLTIQLIFQGKVSYC